MRIKFTKEKSTAYFVTMFFVGVSAYALFALKEADLAELFRRTFNYLEVKNYEGFASSLVLWFLPQITILLFCGNYIEENLINGAAMLLSRTRKLGKIILIYSTEVVLLTSAGCCAIWLAWYMFAVPISGGYGFPNGFELLSYLLYICLVVLAANWLTLFMSSAYAVLVVIGVQLVQLEVVKTIIDGVLPKELYMFLPVSPALFSLNYNIFNINLVGSYLYLVGMIGIILASSLIVLKKKEIY